MKLWLALRIGVQTAILIVRYLRDYTPYPGQVLQIGTVVTFFHGPPSVSIAMRFREDR